jgi:hypothetical protein
MPETVNLTTRQPFLINAWPSSPSFAIESGGAFRHSQGMGRTERVRLLSVTACWTEAVGFAAHDVRLVRLAQRVSVRIAIDFVLDGASAVSLAGLAPAPLRRDGAARPRLRPESRRRSVAATSGAGPFAVCALIVDDALPSGPRHRPLGE